MIQNFFFFFFYNYKIVKNLIYLFDVISHLLDKDLLLEIKGKLQVKFLYYKRFM